MRHARRRLAWGATPALAARKKAACPVRPRTRPCGTQEGGSSCAATHPPLRHARRRLVPCGHAPALAARKKAARPVRPRTRPCGTQEGGLSRAATHPPLRHARRRLVLCGHAPALAAGKKAARLGCNPPPLRNARGRLAWGATPRPPGRLNGRRRRSWRGRGRWDRLRCSPPIPCWASRNPSPWGPGRGNIFQRSPGTAGIPW